MKAHLGGGIVAKLSSDGVMAVSHGLSDDSIGDPVTTIRHEIPDRIEDLLGQFQIVERLENGRYEQYLGKENRRDMSNTDTQISISKNSKFVHTNFLSKPFTPVRSKNGAAVCHEIPNRESKMIL